MEVVVSAGCVCSVGGWGIGVSRGEVCGGQVVGWI